MSDKKIHIYTIYSEYSEVDPGLSHRFYSEPPKGSHVSNMSLRQSSVSVDLHSFGRFGLRRVFSSVQSLQEPEEAGGFPDTAELDTEGLDLDEQVLNIDDLVSDQRLEEDADQSDQPVLEHTDTEREGTRDNGFQKYSHL